MYCDKCRVRVNGSFEHCPLCQGTLLNENGTGKGQNENIFPIINDTARFKFLPAIISFFLAAGSIISVIINIAFTKECLWSAFVVAGAVSAGITMYMVIKKRNNVLSNIVWQVILLSGLSVIWDIFTGWHYWSVEYVLPIVCCCAFITILIISWAMQLGIRACMIYLIIDSIIGLIPLVLILMGIVKMAIPSVICIIISLLFFAVMTIFFGRALAEEISRRFHM